MLHLSTVSQDANHSYYHLMNHAQARIDFLLGQISNDSIGQDPRHDSFDLTPPRLSLGTGYDLIVRLKHLWMQKSR